MASKKTKRVAKSKKQKTVKRTKTGSKGKKIKDHIVDIGRTRPRITGQTGMTQNISVTKQLATSMAQRREKAQGLA